jgi:acyl dehydratase
MAGPGTMGTDSFRMEVVDGRNDGA